MKEWGCLGVGNHRNIGRTIEEWQKKGWYLHTYACAQAGVGKVVNHYLLFERGNEKKMPSSVAAAAAAAAAT